MRAPRGEHGQRDRRQHEDDGCPSGCFGEHSGSGASAEGCLAAHAAKGCGDVSALPALQQHDKDKEDTNNNVDDGDSDQITHRTQFFLLAVAQEQRARNFAGIKNL